MTARGGGCPHGNGDPSQCSQCLGAPVRQVALTSTHIVLDGVPVETHAQGLRRAEDDLVPAQVKRRNARRRR